LVCRFGIRHASSTISSNPTSHTFLLLACTVSCSVKPCGKRARSGRASRGRAARRTIWLVVHPAPERLTALSPARFAQECGLPAPVQPDYVYLGLAVPVTAYLLGYERQVSPSPAAVDPPLIGGILTTVYNKNVRTSTPTVPGAENSCAARARYRRRCVVPGWGRGHLGCATGSCLWAERPQG